MERLEGGLEKLKSTAAQASVTSLDDCQTVPCEGAGFHCHLMHTYMTYGYVHTLYSQATFSSSWGVVSQQALPSISHLVFVFSLDMMSSIAAFLHKYVA